MDMIFPPVNHLDISQGQKCDSFYCPSTKVPALYNYFKVFVDRQGRLRTQEEKAGGLGVQGHPDEFKGSLRYETLPQKPKFKQQKLSEKLNASFFNRIHTMCISECSSCYDKMPDKNPFKRKRFILICKSRGHGPSWWGDTVIRTRTCWSHSNGS